MKTEILFILLSVLLIINTHPQRWFDFGWGWINEFICQHIKNAVKKALVAFMH